MDKDMKQFVAELAEYINNFIVGRENTYITKCFADEPVNERGHAIPVEIKIPEKFKDTFPSYAPIFYAEELLAEFPKSTVAAIGEILNGRITQQYPEFMRILAEQVGSVDKTLDDYDGENIIVTAQPLGINPKITDPDNPFIVKAVPELKLVMCLKGMSSDGTDSDLVYFTPISRDGREVTDADWENAKLNSMKHANLQCMMMKPVDGSTEKPLAGTFVDTANFYEYFYLLSLEEVWGPVIKTTEADRIYIIPTGPYHVRFVIENQDVCDNEQLLRDCKYFVKSAKEMAKGSMPVFVMDTGTYQIMEMKGDDLFAN